MICSWQQSLCVSCLQQSLPYDPWPHPPVWPLTSMCVMFAAISGSAADLTLLYNPWPHPPVWPLTSPSFMTAVLHICVVFAAISRSAADLSLLYDPWPWQARCADVYPPWHVCAACIHEAPRPTAKREVGRLMSDLSIPFLLPFLSVEMCC